MSRKRLIVVGPLPPPYHGVAVSTSLVLANGVLAERFSIEHLDTTDRRTIDNMGKWDLGNLRIGLLGLVRLNWRLRGSRGVLYLPLSENAGGFIRDSLYLWSARLRRWKVTVHIRNSLFREFYGSQPAPLRWWIRLTMKQLDSAAVLGESLRPLMGGFIPAERVAVVPNGTPPFPGSACERDTDLVVYLSNLSRKKGADHAVRAARATLERDPDARFVLAGDWESVAFRDEVHALATGLEGRLTFAGPVSGVAKLDLMANASVLIFPVAWGEGHPRILLEAMAAGLPVVTTNRSTIAETLGDGGIVLDDPEPDALSESILAILRDESRRSRMSATARERWETHYSQAIADRRIADWLSSVAPGAE